MSAARVPDTAASRLSRLLALVPWLTANPGVTVDEAAAHFDVSADQLEKDLFLLICTGRPGHFHDDLVDIQFWDEDRRITVLDPQSLDRPLRLSPLAARRSRPTSRHRPPTPVRPSPWSTASR